MFRICRLNGALFVKHEELKAYFLQWVSIRINERKAVGHKNTHIKEIKSFGAGQFTYESVSSLVRRGEMPDDFFIDMFGEHIDPISYKFTCYPVFITFIIGGVEVLGIKFTHRIISDDKDSCFSFFNLSELDANVIHTILTCDINKIPKLKQRLSPC